MEQRPLIVIGSGLSAWTTIREFRKLDASRPILMLTAGKGDFYAKPTLSNAHAQGRTPPQLVTTLAEAMAKAQGVTLMEHTRVTAIHPASRTVATVDGNFAYESLVLATGAQPIRLPLDGDAAGTVLAVNSLDDFAAFHARLQPGAHLLIIGAGLIGCEFANDLAGAGYRVSVVDPAARPLAALLPEAASEALRLALQELGVNWHLRQTLARLDRDPHSKALQATLSSGERTAVDLVLSAIGLRPDTTLAAAAGLACERGIVVDALLQTSAACVFALGDCAQYAPGLWHQAVVTGGKTMPYVMPIMSAARALAATLAGRPTPVQFPVMPVAIKTPALPLVVVAPEPGTAGQWQEVEPGIWHYVAAATSLEAATRALGFVLAGKQTARRAEMSRLLAPG